MSNPIPLSEAAVQYIEFLKYQGKSKRTLDTYQRDLQQILAFFGPARLVGNMPLPLIGRFLKSDELLRLPNGDARASQTVHKTIRVFRMWMQWLVQVGYLTELILPKSIPRGRAPKSISKSI